jgi:hypothetical protein
MTMTDERWNELKSSTELWSGPTMDEVAAEVERLRAENKRLTALLDPDALTISHMVGYAKGADDVLAENVSIKARLAEAERIAADLIVAASPSDITVQPKLRRVSESALRFLIPQPTAEGECDGTA